MAARVYLPAQLARLYQIRLPLEVNGVRVREIIAELDRLYPGIKDRLTEGPNLRPYILVFVNQEPADLDTPVSPGAEVRFVAAVAGGSETV
ncbi:MAG: molybdopterin synthase sulfur carrier subunit [Chloroflexota bacterium]